MYVDDAVSECIKVVIETLAFHRGAAGAAVNKKTIRTII